MDLDFADEVERQANLLFAEILPRCIDAWFAGRGYRLVAEMLAVHDADAVLALLALPTPSEQARRRAAGVRRYCPLTVIDQVWLQNDRPVLGQYTHHSVIAPHFLSSFQVVAEDHQVWLFEGSFAVALPPERWPHEILLTLFHEYIHAFEAHLPPAYQPLRARELGLPTRPLDPAIGARLDGRHTLGRRALFFGLPALAVVLGIAVAPAIQAPRPELLPEKRAAVVDAGPPRDFPAERAALRQRLAAALLEQPTREGILEHVGRPIGDTTDSFSHGVLTWARLDPRPGQPPLPDLAGRGVMCWPDPDPDLLALQVLCAAWLPDSTVIFEAQMVKKPRDFNKLR